jgi:hypothetical protein
VAGGEDRGGENRIITWEALYCINALLLFFLSLPASKEATMFFVE